MTRASELHDAFDHGFAVAPPPPEPAHTDFLCIQVCGEPAAVPLADVTSLHAGLRIVALPTRAPELLGVAAIRGAVVPIYDLGVALGGAQAASTRWILMVGGGSAGFAVERFDGHVRIPDRAIAAPSQRGNTRGQFTHGGQPRGVVDLGAVLAALESRRRQTGAAKDP